MITKDSFGNKFATNVRKIKVTPKSTLLYFLGQDRPQRATNDVTLVHPRTGEQLNLPDFIAGKRFAEFNPETLFGSAQPSGQQIQAWFIDLYSQQGWSKFVELANAWIRNTVPLDVLFGITKESPGVTLGDNGWHWSTDMQPAKNPVFVK